MADMTELKNIVRLGTVQSVNASKMTNVKGSKSQP